MRPGAWSTLAVRGEPLDPPLRVDERSGMSRYGTPLLPWARRRRSWKPRRPRNAAEWQAALSRPFNYVRGTAVIVVVWIAISSVAGFIAGPPVPKLDLFTSRSISVDGAYIPRPVNWALESNTETGLLRPWILHAPGKNNRPPTTITIYTPVVTSLVTEILKRNGESSIDSRDLLKLIVEEWKTGFDRDNLGSLPAYKIDPVLSAGNGETNEFGLLVTFPDTTFPYAPNTGKGTASPTPAATPELSPGASPAASASPTSVPSSSSSSYLTEPIRAYPVLGTETEARMIVKMAIFIPSSRDFSTAALRKMLVMTLSYDAALEPALKTQVESVFAKMTSELLFP